MLSRSRCQDRKLSEENTYRYLCCSHRFSKAPDGNRLRFLALALVFESSNCKYYGKILQALVQIIFSSKNELIELKSFDFYRPNVSPSRWNRQVNHNRTHTGKRIFSAHIWPHNYRTNVAPAFSDVSFFLLRDCSGNGFPCLHFYIEPFQKQTYSKRN